MSETLVEPKAVVFQPTEEVVATSLSFMAGAIGTLIGTQQSGDDTFWHVVFPCGDILVKSVNFREVE